MTVSVLYLFLSFTRTVPFFSLLQGFVVDAELYDWPLRIIIVATHFSGQRIKRRYTGNQVPNISNQRPQRPWGRHDKCPNFFTWKHMANIPFMYVYYLLSAEKEVEKRIRAEQLEEMKIWKVDKEQMNSQMKTLCTGVRSAINSIVWGLANPVVEIGVHLAETALHEQLFAPLWRPPRLIFMHTYSTTCCR